MKIQKMVFCLVTYEEELVTRDCAYKLYFGIFSLATMSARSIDLVTSPPPGLGLHSISRRDLQACSRHKKGIALSECALLLPAGAGTQSVFDMMQAALAKHTIDPRLVHHVHHVRIASYFNWRSTTWSLKRLWSPLHVPELSSRVYSYGPNATLANSTPYTSAPRCFVIPLRDPVARLRSGLAWAHQHTTFGPGMGQAPRPVPRFLQRFTGFVAAVSDVNHSLHYLAQQMYWNSVSWPTQVSPRKFDAVRSGYNFFTSQLDYLRDWDTLAKRCHAGEAEIHVLCTETLERDAHRFLRAFDDPLVTLPRVGHKNRRTIALDAASRTASLDGLSLKMSETEAEAIVRDRLYPWDAQLHQHVCGGPAHR